MAAARAQVRNFVQWGEPITTKTSTQRLLPDVSASYCGPIDVHR